MTLKANITALYANGNSPNIIGREKELELLILTMMRHEKPNAILHGQPGVGKTAIVHQLAYLIANGKVPKALQGFSVIEVNTNALLAGPGYRGVFEERVQNLIDELLSAKTILFLDEFHTVESLGEMANGQTPGLGNAIKPYLTRPDFRVIGATTSEELKTLKDKALLRRFFKIGVSEPTDDAVSLIITACLKKYGRGLKIESGAVETILKLSKSADGFNPDKAKDITDFMCSFCKMKDLKTVTVDNTMEFFDQYYLAIKAEKEQNEAEFI